MKTCNKCNEAKLLSEFYKSVRGVDGHLGTCKLCQRAYIKFWADNRPEAKKAAARIRRKAWYRDVGRARRIERDYGCSGDFFDRLLAEQGGVCAICQKNKLAKGHGALSVDHDHSTGAIRGILCSRCNTGIGMLGDSADHVARALEYLIGHEGSDSRLESAGLHGGLRGAPETTP